MCTKRCSSYQVSHTSFLNIILSIQKDLSQAYEAQSSLHSAINHALGSSKGNWLIPALHVVCRNTHRAAALADGEQSAGNKNDHARLQNAVTLLQASYSKTLNDRVELRVSRYFIMLVILHTHPFSPTFNVLSRRSPMSHSVKKDQRRLECST